MKSLTIFTYFFVCNITSYSQDTSFKSLCSKYQLKEEKLISWKNDKNGCNKNRENYALEIEKNKSLIGAPKNEFMILFGRPNKISDKDIYVYRVSADCDVKGKVLIQNGYMSLIASFKENKLSWVGIEITEAN